MEGYLKYVALVDAVPTGGLEFSVTGSKSEGDNLGFPWYLNGSMHKPCPVIAAKTGETKFWMTFDTGGDGIMVDQSVMASNFQRHVIGYNVAGGVIGDAPREAPLVETYWRLGSFILQAPVVLLPLHEQYIKQNIKGLFGFPPFVNAKRITINHEPDIVVIEGFRNEGNILVEGFQDAGKWDAEGYYRRRKLRIGH
ncbi:MAG: hypothetical protein ACLP56_12755 [Candidatus Sulfotelmatobacter sp.]